MGVVLSLQAADRLVQIGRHAFALEREAERVIGARRQRHLDGADRLVACVGHVRLREPPDVEVAQPAPGRARAALDRRQ